MTTNEVALRRRTPGERRAYLDGYLTANRRMQEIIVRCNDLPEALRHLRNLEKAAEAQPADGQETEGA